MRPSASKRRYIAVESESDIESDHDVSMNHSLDSSFVDDSLNESLGSRGANYWKNRALVAEARLKAEKLAREADRFSTMTMENIQMVARSRQCHTSTWLASHLDEIDDGSVKEAYLRQIERYENAFTIEEAIENFTAAH